MTRHSVFWLLIQPPAVSLSAIADAAQAISRLDHVFQAELLEETRVIEKSLDVALRVEDASFTWDAPAPNDEKLGLKSSSPGSHGGKGKGDKGKTTKAETGEKVTEAERVFKMSNINLAIPRGKLIAIVGSVGSGKTSLLQGLIGEMRRTSGKITFGGSVGYCSQSAWIQASLVSHIHHLKGNDNLLERHGPRECLLRPTIRGREVLQGSKGRLSGAGPCDVTSRRYDRGRRKGEEHLTSS